MTVTSDQANGCLSKTPGGGGGGGLNAWLTSARVFLGATLVLHLVLGAISLRPCTCVQGRPATALGKGQTTNKKTTF